MAGKNLTRAQLAKGLGIGIRRCDDHLAMGMPRNSIIAAKKWVTENIREHGGKNRPRSEDADPDLNPQFTGDSPALEEYRKARAALANLDLEKRRGELLERAEVHRVFMAIASLVRQCGEALQRLAGSEALTILNETLEEAERQVASLCGVGD